jgi:arsenate reductase
VRVLALLVLAVVVAIQPVASGQTISTVVFVCEHGAAKSVVAAAHLNKLAKERGLPVRAVSRGTAPDAAVPPTIRQGLQGEQLVLDAAFTPTLVTADDVRGAARVITFDVTLPADAGTAAVTRWDALPAFSDGYAAASAAIAAKVEALVSALGQDPKAETVVLNVSGMT